MSRLKKTVLLFALMASAWIDFSTMTSLCVIVIGIIRACQLCLDFECQRNQTGRPRIIWFGQVACSV